MHKLAIVTATVLAMSGGLTAAQAGSLGRPCTSAPQSEWLSLDALKAKAEAQGSRSRKGSWRPLAGKSTPSIRAARAPSCSSTRPRARSSASNSEIHHDHPQRCGRGRRRDAAGNGLPEPNQRDAARLGPVCAHIPLEPGRSVRPRLRHRRRDRMAAPRGGGTPSRGLLRSGLSGGLSAPPTPVSAISCVRPKPCSPM